MVYLFGCFGFTWLKLEFCNYINFKIGRNQQENLDILKNCLHYCKMLKKSKLYLIAFSMVGPFIITPTWSTFFLSKLDQNHCLHQVIFFSTSSSLSSSSQSFSSSSSSVRPSMHRPSDHPISPLDRAGRASESLRGPQGLGRTLKADLRSELCFHLLSYFLINK